MRRRGFSLVEVLVFSAMGLLVLVTVYDFMAAGLKRGARSLEKLEGVDAVLTLSARLEQDLDALYEDPAHPITFTVTAEGTRFSFHRYSEVTSEEAWEPRRLVQVEYHHRLETRVVTRAELPGEPHRIPGLFDQVLVSLERSQLPGRPAYAYRLVYHLRGVARDDPAAAADPGRKSFCRGAVPLYSRSMRSAYPFWHRDPYGPAVY